MTSGSKKWLMVRREGTMRQHLRWAVAAILAAAVGCAGDSVPAADGGSTDAAHFALTAGTPTVALLTPGREAVVELRRFLDERLKG